MTAAGDRRTNVRIGVLDGLGRRSPEEFFQQISPAGDAEFLGQNAQRIFGGNKMDAGDPLVSFKCAQCLAGENCAGCAGDGEGEGEVQLLAPSF
jgi:hypothetical protein